MKKAYLFLADGFEEMEATAPIDFLRRAGVEAKMISITGSKQVAGSHGIQYVADALFEEINLAEAEVLILPGGMPGTKGLMAHKELAEALVKHFAAGKLTAAICAAPMVLAGLGILDGKRATIYPGMENMLQNATVCFEGVVQDGNVITACGPGKAIDFAMALVENLCGKQVAEKLREDTVYQK